ncbi:unnamed protein product [Lathyrus sativus]|nr:unnamed protein product [Lathyrus sativus]
MSRYKKAYFGVVIDSGLTYNIQTSFEIEWYFSIKIKEWKEDMVDKERVTLLRCYGIPCHAWNVAFFDILAKTVGIYVCIDDNTLKRECKNVAIILVRTHCAMVINETFKVMINNEVFNIKMCEDYHGPLHIVYNKTDRKVINDSSSSESDCNWSHLGGEEEYVVWDQGGYRENLDIGVLERSSPVRSTTEEKLALIFGVMMYQKRWLTFLSRN